MHFLHAATTFYFSHHFLLCLFVCLRYSSSWFLLILLVISSIFNVIRNTSSWMKFPFHVKLHNIDWIVPFVNYLNASHLFISSFQFHSQFVVILWLEDEKLLNENISFLEGIFLLLLPSSNWLCLQHFVLFFYSLSNLGKPQTVDYIIWDRSGYFLYLYSVQWLNCNRRCKNGYYLVCFKILSQTNHFNALNCINSTFIHISHLPFSHKQFSVVVWMG